VKLFIVESPAKARKIKTFLGEDYVVEASCGHVLEIPKHGLCIDLEHGFEPTYIVREDKANIVDKIQDLASNADEIFIATDPDREGEAIAHGIYGLLKKAEQRKSKRVTYHEITKKAILHAIDNPRDIDANLVDAAKARQVLDRLIGYQVSPVLWNVIGKGTSAGRVQSVALKLICEKQKEIDAFVPMTYWYVDVLLKCQNGDFWARVVVDKSNEKEVSENEEEGSSSETKNRFSDGKIATETLEKLKTAAYVMANVKKATKSVSPDPPFDTNSLQGACSAILKWDITKTMKVAQDLYTSGKCFLPGTLVETCNGEIRPIETFSEKTSLQSVDRVSFLSSNEKCEPVVLNHDGKILDIKINGGVLLSVTPDHIFPVFDSLSGLIVDKKASDLALDTDFLLKPRKNFCLEKNVHKVNILDVLSKDKNSLRSKKIRMRFKDGFVHSIPQVKEIILRCYSIHTYFKYSSLDLLPLDVVFELIDTGVISKEEIEKNYVGLKIKGSKDTHIPFVLSSEVFYFAGLIASDGHMPRNSGKILLGSLLKKNPRKKDINEYVDVKSVTNKVASSIGINPNRNLNFSCAPMQRVFFGLGIPEGNKSKIIDFPSEALVDNDYCLAFLSGLWDGDGYFTEIKQKNGRITAIQAGFTSCSSTIVRKVQIVLARYGIHSYLHSDARFGILTVKVSLFDVPKLYFLMKRFSKIKTKVYEKIKIDRVCEISNSRNPNNIPAANLILNEIERMGISKNKLSLGSDTDIWRYVRKNKKEVPFEVIKKYAKILNSDLLKSVMKFEFCRVVNKTIRNYSGSVYCFQSPNDYFLVENGIWSHNCTYIRTDSFNISDEALEEVREHISTNHGHAYLPAKANVYVKKAAAASQEAHECIRPTHTNDDGFDLLNPDEIKMYKLVRDRFIACQMNPMKVDSVKYMIDADCKEKLVADGQTISFDGFTKVWLHKQTKEGTLPSASKGEKLEYQDSKQTETKTKPPKRFTDASLANKLETDGVGRPATRAPIIKSLEEKGYITKDKAALVPTPMGFSIVDFLVPSFSESFMDIKFTAGMESEMLEVAEGRANFLTVVEKFHTALKANIDKVGGNKRGSSVKVGAKCSVCETGDIVEKFGKNGKFLTCSRYPDCNTIFSKCGDNYVPKQKNIAESTDKKCPKCGKAMLLRTGAYGKFYGCSGYPGCRTIEKFKPEEKK
jgi:DNA topoisomerase IA